MSSWTPSTNKVLHPCSSLLLILSCSMYGQPFKWAKILVDQFARLRHIVGYSRLLHWVEAVPRALFHDSISVFSWSPWVTLQGDNRGLIMNGMRTVTYEPYDLRKSSHIVLWAPTQSSARLEHTHTKSGYHCQWVASIRCSMSSN
jgi:hypothetical protein